MWAWILVCRFYVKRMKPIILKADPQQEYFFDEGCFILELSNTPADADVSIARARVKPGVTTHLHRLLQKLLDLDTPDYCHHRLLTDGGGARLAKRAGSVRLRDLRAAGQSPAAIIAALDLK